MYKVLIVDDDKLIREDVQTLIDWKSHGFDIIGEADHGEEALGLITIHGADIVFTDIYMPVMDGIELIRLTKSRYPAIKFLVMSNYDDFESVKDAMKYGASDYVLKYKLDPEVLMSLLNQLKQAIESERQEEERNKMREQLGEQGKHTLSEQFWLEWLQGKYNLESAVTKADRLDIPFANGTWLPIMLEGELDLEAAEAVWKDRDRKEGYCQFIRIAEERHLLLIRSEQKSYLYLKQELHEMALALYSTLQGNRLFVMKGEVCSRPTDLIVQYKRMMERYATIFYDGYSSVMDLSSGVVGVYNGMDESVLEKFEQGLIHAIHTDQYEYALKQLDGMEERMRSARFHPKYVQNYYFMLVNQIYKLIRVKSGDFALKNDITHYYDMIHSQHCTLPMLTDQLRMMLHFYYDRLRNNNYSTYREEVKKAISYLEKNYASTISLFEIAEHVGLSKNHFCKLFKKETGVNFVHFVNQIRIEKAKLLILQSEHRIKEIAVIVGLENHRYFSRIFKQMTGFRPMEYKLDGGETE